MMLFADRLQPSVLTELPPRLYEATQTAEFPRAECVHLNTPLLNQLGIEEQIISRHEELSSLQAISTVYAGHQFGIYTSKLGDGRVHILGDLITNDDQRWEVQLKGAGATPFARGNNGQMSLAEAITEYLGCEAMVGLGIASTRGLALIQPSGHTAECILVRTAPSHLRFGHFEYLHNQQDPLLLKALVDHVIARYYSDLIDLAEPQRYLQFLFAVTERTARLLAQWQAVGFVHSVMNTDNMSILGLTLDYGVYGFMQEYDTSYSPNPDDDQQRYAFDQQVDVARWNCLALAEAMITLLPNHTIPASLLRHFRKQYSDTWLALMRNKLGLFKTYPEDKGLIDNLLALLQQHSVDYTRFFRQLSHVDKAVMSDIIPDCNTAFRSWFDDYAQRLSLESASAEERLALMLANNPRYILRPQLLAQAIERAEQAQDFGLFRDLSLVMQSPYAEHENYKHLS